MHPLDAKSYSDLFTKHNLKHDYIQLMRIYHPDRDKYLEAIDGHPELEIALNSALSCTQSRFNEYLSSFKSRTLGYPITDRLINQIKEDLYYELDKDEFYSEFNFRDNPSLIPVIRTIIIKKMKGWFKNEF